MFGRSACQVVGVSGSWVCRYRFKLWRYRRRSPPDHLCHDLNHRISHTRPSLPTTPPHTFLYSDHAGQNQTNNPPI